MRSTLLALALAVGLVAGLGAAPALAAQQPAAVDQDTEQVIEAYNENVDEVPTVIRNRFADERVAITLEREGAENLQYTAVTNADAEVTSVEEGVVDPTVKVTTDEETVREVANSEHPGDAGVEAYESEDVQVEGVGVTNTVKVESVKLGYNIASTLGLL